MNENSSSLVLLSARTAEIESVAVVTTERIDSRGNSGSRRLRRERDAGRLAIRRLIDAMAERDDPYAGADRPNAVRIVALIWLVSGLLTLVMLPLDPPTRIGTGGWLIAAAVIASQLTGGALLRRRGEGVSFNGLLAIAYLGLAQVSVMQWLGSGWESPYSELLLLWVGAGAGVHPPRRALVVLAAVVAAAFLPFAYLGWEATGAERAGAELLLFTTLGLIVMILMTYVRAQRVALRDEGVAAARLARVDQLTGLENRRAFDETLSAEIARARKAGTPLSVALLDVDGFKSLNDRVGHLEGDRCLRVIAAALDSVKRSGDHVFRWGGDEFAIILPGTDVAQARAAVDRISRLDPPIRASDGVELGFCTGIAELETGMTASDLLEHADLDLLGAKRARERPDPEPDLV
jgi:diguanylate cyclase (GGDEF)-like protein